MKSVDELLDEIDAILDKATPLPLFNGKAIVASDEIKELIGDIRLHMPNEISKAREITHERNDIIADARKEAESITRRAEERARVMVSQEEITRRATIQANELISQAQTKARETRKSAIEFAEDKLHSCEIILAEKQKEIRQSISALKTSGKNSEPKPQQPQQKQPQQKSKPQDSNSAD